MAGIFAPWVCPKCGRVYSAMVMQCTPCNEAVTRKVTWLGTITTRDDQRRDTVRPRKAS